MPVIELRANIPLSRREYWYIRSTPEFFALECKLLKNESKRLAEIKNLPDGKICQTLLTRPDLSVVPTFLSSRLGNDGLEFEDTVVIDPAKPYSFTCKTTPSVFADKCDITTVATIALPDGFDGKEGEESSCVHFCRADINVNVWAVGGVVEQLVLNGLRNAYTLLHKMCTEFKELYPKIHPDNDVLLNNGSTGGLPTLPNKKGIYNDVAAEEYPFSSTSDADEVSDDVIEDASHDSEELSEEMISDFNSEAFVQSEYEYGDIDSERDSGSLYGNGKKILQDSLNSLRISEINRTKSNSFDGDKNISSRGIEKHGCINKVNVIVI